MKVFMVLIPICAVVFSLINGSVSELSEAVLSKSGEAVALAISICGTMCLWCGLMKVAEAAGLVEKLSKLLSPPVCLLFGGVRKGSRAAGLITMNLAANILGLGNATTPLGIKAMEELSDGSGAATDDMIMLTVLNTASLQVIPATAAALRAANGAENAMDILPCVWIVSVYATAVAVAAAKIMGAAARRRSGKCS